MPDLTLVRLWRGTTVELPSAFVGWEDGEFTLDHDSPMGRQVWQKPIEELRLSVYSTDELLWVIDRIEVRGPNFTLRVYCLPYVEWLRSRVLSDQHLVEIWLDAEQAQLT